ncbi:MAG: methionine--tRNA ligase [bacterium]
MSTNEKILVTSALPYANGPIHLGHMVEYIQTDIYCRYLRLVGKDCIYCCADDTHGAPIEINARKLGVSPEDLIARYYDEHLNDFRAFHISFDSYYTTNSPENKAFSDLIFGRLKERGDIYTKVVELTYCPRCERFLPDRYVKGVCPKCGASDQYGDNCEVCNATYATIDLINPYCALCGSPPVRKESMHYFFRLGSYAERLRDWIAGHPTIQTEIRNYILHWIDAGLKDWDISRDAPYFGFTIAGEKDKYYYVWLDAPIGYMASCQHYCTERGVSFDEYWTGTSGRVRHFIGKDIIYFHFLFWPAMLMGSGFNLPENIFVHGFLTVNGEKMSKSRGTFVTARQYLDRYPADLLRFYYALNLTNSIADIDLDVRDFTERINSELLGNIANLAYRSMSFLARRFDRVLTAPAPSDIVGEVEKRIAAIGESYQACHLRNALKGILEIGDIGNKYFQAAEPWKWINTERDRAWRDISLIVQMVRDLAICLKPVIPDLCADLEAQLGLGPLCWKDLGKSLEGHTIGEPRQLLTRVETLALVEQNPFCMLDLRVARVLEAAPHPEADRLIVIQVDLGGERRQIVAGIRGHYAPEELPGKNIVVLTNLKPALLKGIESQGMLLAADNGSQVRLLSADGEPGDRVTIPDMEGEPKSSLTIKELQGIDLHSSEGKAFSGRSPLVCNGKQVVVDGGITGRIK